MGARVVDRTGRIRATLAAVALFAPWPPAKFDALCAAAQLWRYDKGEAVFQASTPARGLFVLAQGTMLSARSWPNGKHMATTILRPGWPLAMVSAWDGADFTLDNIARTEVFVVFVPRDAWLNLLRGDAALLAGIVDHLCAQMRQDIEGLQVRAIGSQRCLMAKYLAHLSSQTVFLPRDNPAGMDPTASDVTQDELAAMLSMSRQTVNRLMKEMERDGILVRRGRNIRVTNFLRLLAIMEEDEPIHPVWRAQIVAWHERTANAAGGTLRPRSAGDSPGAETARR